MTPAADVCRQVEFYYRDRCREIDLTVPDVAAGRCYDESCDLVDWLYENGRTDAFLVELEGYKGDTAQVATQWQQYSTREMRRHFVHYVVEYGGYVFDLTTTQLGAGRPVVVPAEQYYSDWSEVRPYSNDDDN